jgi:hypothetical protein
MSLLLTALLLPVGLFLPAWWGWENGPIENMQVVILFAGAVLSWIMARHNTDRQMHNLYLWLIPIWLLIVGRELSWGRVFFDSVSIGAGGPVFPSIRSIWYGRYVYPLNTIVIITALVGLRRNFNWSKIKQIQWPAIEVIIVVVAVVASQLVFERKLILLLKSYSQMLEEWSELIVYWCMVSTLVITGSKKK